MTDETTPLPRVERDVEYESALLDPRVRRMHRLSRADVIVLLEVIALRVQAVKLHFRWRPQLSDPGDEMVLETAVNAMAKTLLTFNERDFKPSAGLRAVDFEVGAITTPDLRDGRHQLAWSHILDFENGLNPFGDRLTRFRIPMAPACRAQDLAR